jgi:hypothetical protein
VAGAQIAGLVSDPSGAAVAGAKITATQTNTGLVRETPSGPDGSYVLPNLPVGPYELKVQASGFSTYRQTGIRLEVSNNVTMNVTLRVGATTQKDLPKSGGGQVNEFLEVSPSPSQAAAHEEPSPHITARKERI